MTIKKSFFELVEFLAANQDKKVSSILDEVLSICESKKQSSTVMYDDDKNVIAIYCYYHKQWELVKDVPYGKKANTNTGLNTMCKVGTSMWTKKQRDAKKAKEQLLISVSNGDVKPSDILLFQDDIETERLNMDMTDMPIGYNTEEKVLTAIK